MRSLRAFVTLVFTVSASMIWIGAAHAASAYVVTVHVNRAAVQPAGKIHLSGKVTGGPVAGGAVALAWTSDPAHTSGWHLIGKPKLSKSGTYSRWWTPKVGGDIYIRAVKAKTSGHAAASALTGVIKVYAWLPWTQTWDNGMLDVAGPAGATTSDGTAVVGGKSYVRSLIINDGATANFASLGCTEIRGIVRIPDDSAVATGGVDLGQAAPWADVYASKSAQHNFDEALEPDLVAHLVGDAFHEGGTANVVAVTGLQLECDQAVK